MRAPTYQIDILQLRGKVDTIHLANRCDRTTIRLQHPPERNEKAYFGRTLGLLGIPGVLLGGVAKRILSFHARRESANNF